MPDWEVNRRVVELAAQSFEGGDAPCLYRFVENGRSIELHPRWVAYLQSNLAIVTGFCLWNLVIYLQRHNPNAPNIAGKLAEPGQRDLGAARRFWRAALAAQGSLCCVYSGELLAGVPSLDHFLPWRFVAHDLLWNIAPTAAGVNSAKSDRLPDFARYFEPFAAQQYAAVRAYPPRAGGDAGAADADRAQHGLCRRLEVDERMMVPSPRNPHSHLTVKDRKWPSYPTKHLLAQGLVQGRVLDFGCGTGTDVAFLRGQGIDITGYDPHYAPAWPAGRFDTILCHYVLNVLLPEEQVQVLMAVAELLEPAGRAYFTVRRDIKRAGFRSHTEYDGVRVYQCNVVLPYRSVLTAEHCEIYEYRPYNQIDHAGPGDCPLCHPTADRALLSESATVYALLDGAAGGPVRVLIVPKAHIASYFDLPDKLRTACWLMVDRARWLLEDRGAPAGWRIEVVVGGAVAHAHVVLGALGDEA